MGPAGTKSAAQAGRTTLVSHVEQQQADGHDDHPGEHTPRRQPAGRVVLECRGKELGQGYVHHLLRNTFKQAVGGSGDDGP